MKIGRNDPCPCGSGKKYKHCCLAKESTSSTVEVEVPLPPKTKGDIKKPIEEALDFAFDMDSWLEKAEEEFFLKDEYEDWELDVIESQFDSWYPFCFRAIYDKSPLEHFIQQHPKLAADQKNDLVCVLRGGFRLIEVQGIEKNSGFWAKDLFTGEKLFIREELGIHQIVKWDLLFTYMYPLGTEWKMTFPLGLPRARREQIAAIVENFRRRNMGYGPADPGLPAKLVPQFLHDLLKILKDSFRCPQLVTKDGELVVFCEALFEVKDKYALLRVLSHHRSFSVSQDSIDWLSGAKRKGIDRGKRSVYGWLELKDDKLVLHTFSLEKLEKGKKLLLKTCGDNLRHIADSLEDLEQSLERCIVNQVSDQTQLEALPEEALKQLKEFSKMRSEKWLDTEIPLLDGHTPRQAAADPKLRPKLLELLKDFENWGERTRTASSTLITMDVEYLKKALGVREEELT